MDASIEGASRPASGRAGLSSTDLVREIASKAKLLAMKEIELARTELKKDFASELATVKSFGVAAVAAVTTVNLLLVAAVFGLAAYMPAWLAALLLAAVMLVVAVTAGLIGWGKHVGRPLARTRKTLREDLQWAKEELT